MIDDDTIVHPYASTRLFAWEDPMGCPKRHGATGVEQNINYDDLCSKKAGSMLTSSRSKEGETGCLRRRRRSWLFRARLIAVLPRGLVGFVLDYQKKLQNPFLVCDTGYSCRTDCRRLTRKTGRAAERGLAKDLSWRGPRGESCGRGQADSRRRRPCEAIRTRAYKHYKLKK